MTLQKLDLTAVATLAVVVLPLLFVARKRPRLGLLLLVATCVAAPIALFVALRVGGFAMLRLLAWGVFAGFPAGALGIALLSRTKDKRLAVFSLGAALCTLGVYGFAFHVEPGRLEVNHHELVSPRLDEPLRIVVLADIQTDRVTDYERRALQYAREAEADLILLAGDYLQCGHGRMLERQTPRFRQLFTDPQLHAPLGVHAVAGNCEAGWNWTPIFEGTGVQVYEDTQTVDLGPIVLSCLSFTHSRLGRTTPRLDERFHIALGHYPDFALGSVVDADLLLAGHCHGGQVRVPFFGPPIKLSAIPRSWTQGLTPLDGDRHLLVSRGIGMERGPAPRLRFLCRPEVVVIDLIPAAEGPAAAN